MKDSAGERLRILVVEDEPLNRALLRASLVRAQDPQLKHAQLTEASSLADARRVLAESENDLVLLDRRLTDGDGFELAREIAGQPEGQRPLVVALTADAVPATRAAAAEAGCVAVLTKPFRPSQLVALLEGLLASD